MVGGDHLVCATGLVLINQRRPFAVMTHACHQVLDPRTRGRGEGVPCAGDHESAVPPPLSADGRPDILLKLLRLNGPLNAAKDQRTRLWPDELGHVLFQNRMIAAGMPTTLRPALDMGGPRTIAEL
jgi:hypothetical protein